MLPEQQHTAGRSGVALRSSPERSKSMQKLELLSDNIDNTEICTYSGST
jgi:hypothetical protein